MEIKSIKSKVSEFIDVDYFIKFFLLLIALYYFNIFIIAVTDPKGTLNSPWLNDHLNYITWLRNSLLYAANAVTHALGVNSYVELPYRLKVAKGAYVEAVYSCLGFGLMSFWIAYVAAHSGPVKSKILWCTVGVSCIWCINSIRISLLLIALNYNWKINHYMDHHTLFNICAYILIILLVYRYYIESKKVKGNTVNETCIPA